MRKHEEEIAQLVTAMTPPAGEAELISAIAQLQAKGLPAREIYDDAREQLAKQGQYAKSFRELMQGS